MAKKPTAGPTIGEPTSNAEASADSVREYIDSFDDAPNFNPSIDGLVGAVRDAILTRVRTMPKVWAIMPEQEQIELANGVELEAKAIVRKAVALLTDYPWPRAVVRLGEVKIGSAKGIEGKFVCENITENREVLGDHVNTEVVILMIDSETFMNYLQPAVTDADQPDLPLDQDDFERDPLDPDDDEAGAA